MAKLGDIVFDAAHPASLARFWAVALDGYAVAPYDDEELARLRANGINEPEDDPSVLVEPAVPGAPRLFFTRVPEPKTVKNRVHLDLRAADIDEETSGLDGGGEAGSEVASPGEGKAGGVVAAAGARGSGSSSRLDDTTDAAATMPATSSDPSAPARIGLLMPTWPAAGRGGCSVGGDDEPGRIDERYPAVAPPERASGGVHRRRGHIDHRLPDREAQPRDRRSERIAA